MACDVIYDDAYCFDDRDKSHMTPGWLYVKSRDWANEEEVRIILPPTYDGPLFELPPGVLSRVILGKDMDARKVGQIREWAERRNPSASVVSAKWDDVDLRLAIVS